MPTGVATVLRMASKKTLLVVNAFSCFPAYCIQKIVDLGRLERQIVGTSIQAAHEALGFGGR